MAVWVRGASSGDLLPCLQRHWLASSVPNSIANVFIAPGIVVRTNCFVLGQTPDRADQDDAIQFSLARCAGWEPVLIGLPVLCTIAI